MPYCIKCVPFDCVGGDGGRGSLLPAGAGIISLEWSTSTSLRYLNDMCTKPPSLGGNSSEGGGNSESEYMPGPVLGNVALSCYAFTAGDDRWLGVRCMGRVNGSQQFMQKYDYQEEEYYLIPTRNNTGQITGDVPTSVAELQDKRCETTTYRAVSMNGATVATEMGTELGGKLAYYKHPIQFEFPIMEHSFSILGFSCVLTSFSLNIDFPNPPIANYTFQFIGQCDGSSSGGGGGGGGERVTLPPPRENV